MFVDYLHSGGFWGTAVCTFSLATIEYVFSQSPFKAQRTFESNWRPLPDSEVPRPRPGQVSCITARILVSHEQIVRPSSYLVKYYPSVVRNIHVFRIIKSNTPEIEI